MTQAITILRGLLSAAAVFLHCTTPDAFAADKVLVAGNRLAAIAPLYIAMEKGLFADEGLEVSLVRLSSATDIATAVTSGSVQFGMSAFSADIYSLAGKGGLKVIAGGSEECPGFHGVALVANKRAYDWGLKKPTDLVGRRVAITAIGSSSHNQLIRLAKKYGFKFQDIQVVPLQTLANEVSAIKSGHVDLGPLPAILAKEVEASGDGKIIAWMGDEVPTQYGGVFAAPGTISGNRGSVAGFVRAYGKAVAMYDRAFQQRAPDGTPIRGEMYDDLLGIIAERTGETRAALAVALPYFDPRARLVVEDMAEQIDVYKSLKLVDRALNVEVVLDRSFVAAEKK
jgi:NitT/TauT family transport system substrate-binding protein